MGDDTTIYTIDTTVVDDTFLTSAPSTITITSPEEEIFASYPDFESHSVKNALGADIIQVLKAKIDE
jgi:hypothetical protein